MAFDQKAAGYGWVDYFYLVKAKWPMIVLCFSLLMMVGVGVRIKTPRVYEAPCRIAVDLPDEPVSVRSSSTQMQSVSLDKLSRIEAGITDRAVLLEVVDSCDLVKKWGAKDRVEALGMLKERVRVEADENGEYFDVIAKALSKEGAVEIANSVGLRFVGQSEANATAKAEAQVRELTAEVNSRLAEIQRIEDRLYELARPSTAGETNADEAPELRRKLVSENYLVRSYEAKLQLATVELGEATSGLSVLATAGPEDARSADGGYLSVFLYGFAGMMLGCCLIGLTSPDKSRAKVLNRIGEALGIKLVGIAPLPQIPLSQLNRPHGPVVEAYRDLRQRIHRLPAADSMLLTMVPTDRKAEIADVAANLSTVIADAGHTVVVIDADFRGGRLPALFEASSNLGLSDFLSGEMRMEETVVKTRRPNLWLMPAGPVHDDPCGLLASKRMDDLVWDMRSRFDYVIMVSPSIEETSDAGALIGYSDHTVVVSAYRGHSPQKLRRVQQRIESSGGEASGIILSQKFTMPKSAVKAAGGAQRKVKGGSNARPRL
ncbi:MAG: hypothetical protein HRU46_06005 [Verrucomicrobiales bacterium]|nr:hypothetical protein [Verrucomicrobiales bacterium]